MQTGILQNCSCTHILKYNVYALPRLAVLLIELATSLPNYFHCQWRRRGNEWFLFDCADRNDNLEDTLHLLDPVPLDGIEQFRQKLLLTISGPDDNMECDVEDNGNREDTSD